MSKKKSPIKQLKGIGYSWIETKGGFIPIVVVGKITVQLEPRPVRMFMAGEREALMVQLGNEIMKEMFGHYRFIPNEHGHIVENPAWAELESFDPNDQGEEPEPEPENTIVGLDGKPVEK